MINKPGEISRLDETQVPLVNQMFDALFLGAMSIKYASDLPTKKTVAEKELVVYDDGNGVKRIYMITGKGNLGYISLT
jgi:hypothetical protein